MTGQRMQAALASLWPHLNAMCTGQREHASQRGVPSYCDRVNGAVVERHDVSGRQLQHWHVLHGLAGIERRQGGLGAPVHAQAQRG
jgi:hypothetical protein